MKDPQQVYIALYHHKNGQSHAVFSFKPTDAQLAEFWKNEYEPEREDEYFEVVGPFEVLDEIKER